MKYMKSKKSDDNEDKFQSHFYTLNEFKNKIIKRAEEELGKRVNLKMSVQSLLTAGPGSPVSPFLPFLPRFPCGPGGPEIIGENKKRDQRVVN